MKMYKRISLFVVVTLITLFVCTTVFGSTANAQTIEDSSFGIQDKTPVLEVMQSKVAWQDYELTKEQLSLVELKTTKVDLEKTIEEIQQEIVDLEAKVKAKKAEEARKAEAARLAALTRRTYTSYSSSGNSYGYGYCTWYVKNMRPSLPNGLGNANQWYSRAQSFGLATGTTPQAGAVGASSRGPLGHVVYVHSVNSNGTINISDMNYSGWNVVTYRTVSANEYVYIY